MRTQQTDRSHRYQAAILALFVLGLSGCFSRITGNEGKFAIAYPAAADVVDFNKPLAPGSSLDLYAKELGSNDELNIRSAESSAPDVITIRETHQNFVTITAKTVGSATISITTEDGLVDRVHMHVRTPKSVEFRHSCTDGEFAVYPADDDVVIPFELRGEEGQPIAGYGFWPVKIRPTKALAIDKSSRAQGALVFRSTWPRHRVSIRSTIDDNLIGLALANAEDIDGAELWQAGIPRMVEGDRGLVGFDPTVAGVPMCQAEFLTRARSLTPDICAASGRLGEEDDEENASGLVGIKAHEFGVCVVEVSFPNANGGEGILKRVEIPVGKMPGSDQHQTAPTWLAPILALLAPLALFPWVRRRL